MTNRVYYSYVAIHSWTLDSQVSIPASILEKQDHFSRGKILTPFLKKGGWLTLGIGEADSLSIHPGDPITSSVFKGHEKPIPIFTRSGYLAAHPLSGETA
jgi:hypothetical protein